MIRAVFLDAGLTLLRAEPSLGGVYAQVTLRHGLEVDPAQFDRAAEAAFHAQAKEHRAAGEAGLRTSDDEERVSWRRHARRVMEGIPAMGDIDFDGWFEDLYADFGSARVWTPFEDVLPALGALRARGLRLAVVSNWDSRLRAILDDHDLRRWFDAVVISSEVGWRKPHPAIFRSALAAMDVAAGEVLHVGDSAGDDVAGAEGAGIRPVFLDRGGGRTAGSASVIRGLREIERLLPG